jgi:WD40 repeat protein
MSLLSYANAQSANDTDQKVTVKLLNKTLQLDKPQPVQQGDVLFSWSTAELKYSPDQKSAVILFELPIAKNGYSKAYLVKSNGTIQELSNSSVFQIEWSKDGKYILGAGNTTLRVWNLSGRRRQTEVGNIDRFVVRKNSVCVETSHFGSLLDPVSGLPTPYKTRFVQNYSVPLLIQLESGLNWNTSCQAQP